MRSSFIFSFKCRISGRTSSRIDCGVRAFARWTKRTRALSAVLSELSARARTQADRKRPQFRFQQRHSASGSPGRSHATAEKDGFRMKENLIQGDLPILEYRKRRDQLKRENESMIHNEAALAIQEGSMFNHAAYWRSTSLYAAAWLRGLTRNCRNAGTRFTDTLPDANPNAKPDARTNAHAGTHAYIGRPLAMCCGLRRVRWAGDRRAHLGL